MNKSDQTSKKSGRDILRSEYEARGYEISDQELNRLMVGFNRSRQAHRGVLREHAEAANNKRSLLKKKLRIGKVTVESVMRHSANNYNALYDEMRVRDQAEAADLERSVMEDIASLPETHER